MSGSSGDDWRDAVDHVAIDRVVRAYADAVNRRAWPELDGLFTPDAHIHLDLGTRGTRQFSGPGEIGEFIDRAIAGFDFFEFGILSSHIILGHLGDPDRAAVRLWMTEIRHSAAEGRWTTVYGLYQDILVRTPGGWRFSERYYNSLARSAADLEVLPTPPDRFGG